VSSQHACGAFAQARCATSHDENFACDVHAVLLKYFVECDSE
jgi:hypothetical protein